MNEQEYQRDLSTITMNAEWLNNFEQQLREQIAKEIEDSYKNMWIVDLVFNNGKPTYCIRVNDATAIARGQK